MQPFSPLVLNPVLYPKVCRRQVTHSVCNKNVSIAGSTFNISVAFSTKNGTGTGEIDVVIHTQDHLPLGQSELMKPKDSGTYHVFWLVKAEPDADCDPTQGPCEMWLPGNYSVEVGKCEMTSCFLHFLCVCSYLQWGMWQ